MKLIMFISSIPEDKRNEFLKVFFATEEGLVDYILHSKDNIEGLQVAMLSVPAHSIYTLISTETEPPKNAEMLPKIFPNLARLGEVLYSLDTAKITELMSN